MKSQIDNLKKQKQEIEDSMKHQDALAERNLALKEP